MQILYCPFCHNALYTAPARCPFCGAQLAGIVGFAKKIHAPSLVLSIIGIVFALILPIVTYPCSIVGLVMAVKKRETHKTMAALVIAIIGLVIAIANSAIGAYLGVTGML